MSQPNKISYRLSDEEFQSLASHAQKHGLSPSLFARELLKTSLFCLDDNTVLDRVRENSEGIENLEKKVEDLYNGIATSLCIFLAQSIGEDKAVSYLQERFPNWNQF